MKLNALPASRIRPTILLALCLSTGAFAAPATGAGDTPSRLDDFSKPGVTAWGTPRLVISDSSTGGASHLEQRFEDGILHATGEIAPARGQPGWVSTAFLLTPDGTAADLSRYEGIRLRIRVSQGMLAVSANSTKVDNFDYHAATLQPQAGTEFRDIRLPFKDLKRAWSAQTKLDLTTIASISLVAIGVQPGHFDYAIDEIGFY